ncbi:putative molybdopterin oxidoreductase, molybdopterin-containing subunit [Candidatus Kuenenia stuttgartiensis]|uniref:Putative molybdopterin oxidoreductase, molybdopterin-containing subunit n=1 Tax=Kuenenia stuttgartiensis TaxID=174633 RepID=A0A6G7GY96_KUEST|nr:molybdopterin-dependent oxidoreductase [Candidatus Kuenenia stuttgartiensis]QII14239.1 putative molybdopterin oxidoreductase, molybdopterin-containing subunit [Candidatus Kuenenia stuttgartiensis]
MEITLTDNIEKTYKSICRICHGGCGVIVSVQNGKVVKVKGDPASPMNKGWMCIKGVMTPEIANHPDRLRTPLLRKGKRGGMQWESISWERALEEIARKLDALKKEHGAESIALGQGTGRHHYMHVVRFANALGTPNWYEPGLAQCFIPRITVSNIMYGGFVVGDYYGDVPPKCILFWGHNPLVSGPDGELAISVKRALDKGAIGIAVDPRRSETAKRCKQWLPVRPGTDAALALAMMHVIIKENIYDKEFVDKWTHGFSELREHVKAFTPEWAETITWVAACDIVNAARTYALNKPAILEWGLGIEQNTNSLQTVRSIAILRALTGNIDNPGGDIIGKNIIRSYPTLKEKLPEGMLKKRLGADTFKLLGGWRAFMPSAHIPALFKAMRTGDPYQIRALLIFGNNPLTTVANPGEVYESLQRLELLVVTDLFMTPTAALADYVLPAAFWPEVEQVIGYPLVVENMVMAQQKITQHAECRQDEWIINELSKRLHLPGSEESLEDVMNYQLEPLGIDYQKLKTSGFFYPPHQYKRYEEKGFRTPSKKVELYSKSLQRLGYDPLPTYKEPPESPVQSPKLVEQFPYVLITGCRKKEFFQSEHRQIPSLRKRRPYPQTEMHPEVAAEKGINHGDWVIVSSPRGSIRMKAQVTEDIHPRVISVEHGWWFPEKVGPEFGVWESNANVLTNNKPPYDPAFGSYQLRGLLCAIEKEKT